MFTKFEKEISNLTERNTTMSIEEFLLDRAKKEGKEEGKEEGGEEGIRETARKMKQSGLAINLIASITGFSIEEIEKL